MSAPHHPGPAMPSASPATWLGVMGGGQLGRMFAHAAQAMGYKVAVLEPAGWQDIETHPTERSLEVGGAASPADAAAGALDVGPIRGLLDGRPADVRDRVQVALTTVFEEYADGGRVVLPGGYQIVTARR